MNSRELRQKYFDFFKTRSHEIVPSAPMVVKNDPTLMFTNAGMNQFKDIFLGNQESSVKRVANSQKCLRVSGKHNDLEEVGHDTYHHTMFEMLGNWSFGDYFKKEAIEWAWEFLTGELGIDPDRVYASVFEGSPEENVPRDTEAASVWEKCWSDPSDRIVDGSKKDNFWEMGDTGPCGPCSEIHIDLRSDEERRKVPGHLLVNRDHPRVIEIWNLVFIQYNRKADGSLESLPDRHVDTGMGFERLCMVVQKKESNYDTDIFQDIIGTIASITGIKYGSDEATDTAMRVVADHLRAVAFSIADGQVPSNNKAGYVIRRILRRATRYGYTYLGQDEPFINQLVPALVKNMGGNFPELQSQADHISQVILHEERTFLNTLGKGIRLIEKELEGVADGDQKLFSGSQAFTLYDTYGFPLDLTELILKERGMKVDSEGFDAEMKLQKSRSREDAKKERSDWTILSDDTSYSFTGYHSLTDTVRITRYRSVSEKGRSSWHLVFDRSPFYAESGGQAGDTGTIENEKGTTIIVNTVKENNLTIHIADELPAEPGLPFKASVDVRKRRLTAYNHTATHLMHHALRQVLGKHVEQKGSLVTHEKLRFDFSHFQKPSAEEIARVEKIVNELILLDLPSSVAENIPMQEALDRGAIALFGEKYGESVRVVSFGDSVELCGGTHVDSTASVGVFKIVSEGAIASGIRRIEALTSAGALEWLNGRSDTVDRIASILGIPGNVEEAVARLAEDNSALRKSLAKAEAEAASRMKETLISGAEEVNGLKLVLARVNLGSVDTMKKIAANLKEGTDNLVAALGAEINGKANLLVMITGDLVESRRLDASAIIREISVHINGGGGGQPFLATAGGKNSAGIEAALNQVREIVGRS